MSKRLFSLADFVSHRSRLVDRGRAGGGCVGGRGGREALDAGGGRREGGVGVALLLLLLLREVRGGACRV